MKHDSSRIKRFLRDSATYAVSGAATTFIGVVMLPIYTRVFSPEEYGALDLVSSLLAFGVLFLLMGQPGAVGRFYVDAKDEWDAKVSASTSGLFVLAVTVGVSGASLLFCRDIAALLHGTTAYSTAVAWAICSLPFTVQFRLLQNLIKWRQEPIRYAALSISSLVIGLTVIIYLVVVLRLGVAGVFAATLINSVAFCILALALVRTSLAFTFSIKRLRELLSFGLPLVPTAIAYYFINFSARYFLRYHLDLETVGMYAIGVRVSMVIALLLNGFQMAMGPFIYSQYREEKAPETFAKTFDYVSVAAAVSVTALSLFAADIINVVAVPGFLPGHNVVPLLGIGTVAYGLGSYFSVGIGIAKKTYHRAWTSGLAAAVSILLNYFLVPWFGMVSAAVFTACSFLLMAVLQMRLSQRLYEVPYRFGRNLLMYLVSVAALGLAFAADLDEPALSLIPVKVVLIGAVLGAAFATGLVTKREFAELARSLRSYLQRRR